MLDKGRSIWYYVQAVREDRTQRRNESKNFEKSLKNLKKVLDKMKVL